MKSKHSGLLTFQGYHSPSLHQLPYYWYKVTALEKEKKNNTIKQLIHFMKKGMYLIRRVYHGRILFFFISSASLSFWLLFGNFFFSVNFFHTHERPNRKFSFPSWSYVSIAFFLSSICLLPIFKKKMNKEIGLAKF